MSLRRWWQNKWEKWWVPIYCRFARFHLMRAKSDGHFIIVYGRKDPDESVGRYYIVSSHWTSAGCRRAAMDTLFWEALVEKIGRENILAAMKKESPDARPHAVRADRRGDGESESASGRRRL